MKSRVFKGRCTCKKGPPTFKQTAKACIWVTKCSQINPLTTNAPHHIETSQLIYIANQLTGFYMMGNIGP